jgi:UDP-N-acetylglucosamine--N-acetylmuramyl-(pentapeptide) pyrophosphoryl-undecaprenol N-acetylglucosamine transferase
MVKKILILAGGGGHTGYAQILAEELKGKADLSFLVPDDDPLSRSRLEPYGTVESLIKPRHPRTSNWVFIVRLLKAFLNSSSLIPRNLDVVVSTGSNFCIPPAIIAWMKGIPNVYLESRVRFTSPSKTASILRHFSKLIALQWEEQKKFINGTIFGPLLPKRKLEPWDGGYILVAGGTYGYKKLFDAFMDTAYENVTLQTGGLDPTPYIEKHPKWKVISYSDTFHELLAGAKVVVCPPGGTPIEALVYKKPIVIVRYPMWTRAAGLDDTRLFAERLNAPLLSSLTPQAIEKAVEEALTRDHPNFTSGTETLVESILSLP